MSTLSDHVDRITQLARSIRSTAASTSFSSSASPSGSAGPFTNAVLHTPLGDLIRDIDPAELGLFTLVQPAKHATHDVEPLAPPHGEIARVEFLGATPLRKPPAPKPGRPDQRMREHEPEVYSRAALKYLDRYQSIRPMPRASEQAVRIAEQLASVRASIKELNDKLKQTQAAGPLEAPLSPRSSFAEEERRIQYAHDRIAELMHRKENLLKQKSNGRNTIRPPTKPQPKPQTPHRQPVSSPDVQEDTFWNTPAAATRTLHFVGDSLLDEDMNQDLANVSALSFGSPVPAPTAHRGRPIPGSALRPEDQQLEDESFAEENSVQADAQDAYENGAEEADDDDLNEAGSVADAEQTVVLPKWPAITDSLSPLQDSVQRARHDLEPELIPRSDLPSSSESLPEAEATSELRRSKIRVTTELEEIISRIWVTIGEVVMPGHRFDVTGTKGGARPPRAKETIAHLQTLSTHTPAPSSPTTSSLSSYATATMPPASGPSQPTAQQILTAHMLLALLSSPQCAMSLGSLKEALAGTSAASGAAITRPIYGCVAKRLLKIERGGGEQVVKFDV